ncbi:MAG: hypothetical protein PUE18_04645 [Firmicutes bacterium]|nr:hypothetical protein [Bacillota bacterium]
MIRFNLTEEQIAFLKEIFHEEEIVQKVLKSEEDFAFLVDVDTKIDFMDFLEDAAVDFMDKEQEATAKTRRLEEIRDSIYYQTN